MMATVSCAEVQLCLTAVAARNLQSQLYLAGHVFVLRMLQMLDSLTQQGWLCVSRMWDNSGAEEDLYWSNRDHRMLPSADEHLVQVGKEIAGDVRHVKQVCSLRPTIRDMYSLQPLLLLVVPRHPACPYDIHVCATRQASRPFFT